MVCTQFTYDNETSGNWSTGPLAIFTGSIGTAAKIMLLLIAGQLAVIGDAVSTAERNKWEI